MPKMGFVTFICPVIVGIAKKIARVMLVQQGEGAEGCGHCGHEHDYHRYRPGSRENPISRKEKKDGPGQQQRQIGSLRPGYERDGQCR